MDAGYQVANGPAIHPNGRWMLHNDSGRRTVYAFDLDAELGTLANRRVWKVLSDAEGYPDGMTFDADGCLWLAHWGAGCVSRYAETGDLMRAHPPTHIAHHQRVLWRRWADPAVCHLGQGRLVSRATGSPAAGRGLVRG